MNLVHIVFEIITDDALSLLPHLYNAVRRFELHFKSVVCPQSDFPCHLCKEQSKCCPYRSVFGQVLSTDPDVVRRHQKPPLPFAFKIKDIEHNKSCIELGMVIAGNAIRHVSVFHAAIGLMIDSIAANYEMDVALSGTSWCLDYQGGRHEFSAASSSLILLSSLEILQGSQHSDAVRIYLESPLKLLWGASIAHSFDFGVMLRSQLRRCSTFFAYYGEGELNLDYVFLSENAERVTSLAKDFSFTKPEWTLWAGLAGILGKGEFTGLVDGMMPLLMLGSYLNAGKGATYGMGVYRIEEV